MTKEAQEKIEQAFPHKFDKENYNLYDSMYKEKREAARFGYSVALAEAQGKITEKDKHIKYAERVSYETSVKNADLMAEVERLRGLIEKMYCEGVDTRNGNAWQQFKTENQL